VFAAVGVILAYFYLEETLPSMRKNATEKNNTVSSIKYGAVSNASMKSSAPSPPPSVMELLSIPMIRALTASGLALGFICAAFDVLFVLFCYSPIETGGLSFSVSQIGYSLAICGIVSAAMQLCLMPTLLRTFDSKKMYNFCMGIWPLTFLALPFLNLIARYGVDESTGTLGARATSFLWIGIAVVLTLSRIACLAFGVSMILVKEHAPGPATLGATNGLIQFAMCFTRAWAPALVSSAFALSMENHVLGGHAWVVMMIVLCAVGCSFSWKMSALDRVK